MRRGRRLIESSLQHGVLSMRAHLEVDTVVGHKCLDAGRRLREEFKGRCHIQLAIFVQEALLYPEDKRKQEKMLQLIIEACQVPDITVIGSAPYVETAAGGDATSNAEAQRDNIRICFDLADKYEKDVDFHLDYNVNKESEPLLWYVLEEAHRRDWRRHICIGHATRMSLFNSKEWDRVESLTRGLHVSFVGLPHSDLYMQGRDIPYPTRNRATLPLLECVSRFIPAALSVK